MTEDQHPRGDDSYEQEMTAEGFEEVVLAPTEPDADAQLSSMREADLAMKRANEAVAAATFQDAEEIGASLEVYDERVVVEEARLEGGRRESRTIEE